MSSFALITGKTLGEMMADEAIFLQMVDAATQLQNTGRALGVRENTNYREYLSNMGKKLPNHMMTITKDPSEHEAIIDMPIRIAKALGEDTSKLESIAAQSRRAADRLKSRNSQPQPQ